MNRGREAPSTKQTDERRWAVIVVVIVLAGCGGGGGEGGSTNLEAPAATANTASAFFYQDVNAGSNSVRAGTTTDGRVIDTYGVNVVTWQVLGGQTRVYGDPVYSRLSNGRWVMTAGTGDNDPRGRNALLYHEASCPKVDDAAVRVISGSTDAACETAPLIMAKTSQIFEADGTRYLLTSSNAKIYLARLSDSTRASNDVTTICLRRTRAATLSALLFAEATLVIDSAQAPGLLLSDSAIARRRDGTWVMFVKGIAANNGCTSNTTCELCARGIYRTTSTDLLTWTTLERVVSQASVPDAGVAADGTVWLYWQNFAATCAAQDINLAARSPISGAAESSSGSLGTPINVSFLREPFETNAALHYPTNGTPVHLPDVAAKSALDACFR
jgi:hypothetical protein